MVSMFAFIIGLGEAYGLELGFISTTLGLAAGATIAAILLLLRGRATARRMGAANRRG